MMLFFVQIKCSFLLLKIISLAIFFALVCRKANDDQEAEEFLDDHQIDLENDEEYLHSLQGLFID